MTDDQVEWVPPPRPEWLVRVNDEGRHMDIAALVPLDPDELIATAKRSTGFSDFGDERWREPFQILVKSLDEEAQLHFFGRLMTRNDLLNHLRALLQIQHVFKRHPEIAQQKIDRPLFIAAVPRSGSSILFELLSLDPGFGSPRQWEMMFPCPPPEKSTYETDPRIAKCQHLIQQWTRVAPSLATIHEMDARLPNECIFAQAISFTSEYFPSQYQIPSYIQWLATKADWSWSYGFYKRVLQVLQWRNPRRHWLLKAPSHLNYLPTIFEIFPDARVLLTHRDPVVAQASVTNLMGTLFWIRSDKPMEVKAFAGMLSPEAMAFGLNRTIDWLESGAIPKDQCMSSLYADLIQQPVEAIRKIYDKGGLDFTPAHEARIRDYLAAKPQGKHGRHAYSVAEAEEAARRRNLFKRYQDYFGVPNEI
ncbi:MAG TPA: sulfotransferase [Alphaproteobacteria bacterium]|nr:sulfotransferase [Alphaproteobacteria bacterium]